MIEKIKAVLQSHEIKCKVVQEISEESAEFPLYTLIYHGKKMPMWQKLKTLALETGVWPLAIFGDSVPDLIESSLASIQHRISGVEEVTLPDRLDENLLALNELFTSEKPATAYYRDKKCLPYHILSNTSKPLDEKRLRNFVLVPAKSSWEAFAHCTTAYGRGAVKDDDRKPTAWVHHWEEKYGAQLYLYDGSLSFYVERPPRTPLEAYELAGELVWSGFGAEDLAQGFINEQTYIAHLLGNRYWSFWWD